MKSGDGKEKLKLGVWYGQVVLTDPPRGGKVVRKSRPWGTKGNLEDRAEENG